MGEGGDGGPRGPEDAGFCPARRVQASPPPNQKRVSWVAPVLWNASLLTRPPSFTHSATFTEHVDPVVCLGRSKTDPRALGRSRALNTQLRDQQRHF